MGVITELRLTARLSAAPDDDDVRAAQEAIRALGAELAAPGPDVATATARLEDSQRFAGVVNVVAERLAPERMLLEAGPELDEVSPDAVDGLAAFRFGAYAGVALQPAPASWYRAYLESCGLRLDERPAGALTLFSNGTLGGPRSEVFVPWRGGHRYEVEAAWLASLPWIPQPPPVDAYDPAAPVEQRSLAFEPRTADEEQRWLVRVREELDKVGLQPAPLPIAAAAYVVPLLAHPDAARRAAGTERYVRAAELSRAAIAVPYDELSPSSVQKLELTWLRAVRFAGTADSPIEVLLSIGGAELNALASSAAHGVSQRETEVLDTVQRVTA
jgi:hypothetical protein